MDSSSAIKTLVSSQREYFLSGATLPKEFRKKQLRSLKEALLRHEKELYSALKEDLNKSEEEAFLTEISIVLSEINYHLRHLGGWMTPQRKRTPIALLPSRYYISSEPLGCALIVSPWNYPVQLLLNPLVGALSAGCTALLKPSPKCPNVNAVLQRIIKECFPKEYVAVVEGHRDVNEALFACKFDVMFVTGSPELGRVAMRAAAENLTPLVLELGGKSPCVVDEGCNLHTAALRIAWGKTLNAGQTCIAPDYILIHKDLLNDFVAEFKSALRALYEDDILESDYYPKIIDDAALERLSEYLKCGTVLAGGRINREKRLIEPTLLGEVPLDSPVMKREIFGPVFPVITFGSLDEAAGIILSKERPLALYYFGKKTTGRKFLRQCPSGGACINDTIVHIVAHNVPFGGVGNSGMGAYHGRHSFLAFSHERTIVETPNRPALLLRKVAHAPLRLLRKVL